MRRFFLTTFFLLTTSLIFAQLDIVSESDKIEEVGTIRLSYSKLIAQGSTYYLMIRTSNQFDDGTLFCLGKTAESSIMTAQDMITLINRIDVDAPVDVCDSMGEKAIFIKKKMIGKPNLVIKMINCAGNSNITS
ncbi:MAG: hypothetical protein IKZ50_02130 [Bacteroidales bacterium]|nr:hypothetical protein [Bacteroidales bacterium]